MHLREHPRPLALRSRENHTDQPTGGLSGGARPFRASPIQDLTDVADIRQLLQSCPELLPEARVLEVLLQRSPSSFLVQIRKSADKDWNRLARVDLQETCKLALKGGHLSAGRSLGATWSVRCADVNDVM